MPSSTATSTKVSRPAQDARPTACSWNGAHAGASRIPGNPAWAMGAEGKWEGPWRQEVWGMRQEGHSWSWEWCCPQLRAAAPGQPLPVLTMLPPGILLREVSSHSRRMCKAATATGSSILSCNRPPSGDGSAPSKVSSPWSTARPLPPRESAPACGDSAGPST